MTRIINELGYKLKLNDHTELYNLLEEAIYEDAPITLKDGYLIKELSPFLNKVSSFNSFIIFPYISGTLS